nr:hypothetical protein [Tanacetum cinerariifolium]
MAKSYGGFKMRYQQYSKEIHEHTATEFIVLDDERVRDSGYLAAVEVGPRETSLRDDVIARDSDEPHLEQDIDPEIHIEIDECFDYAYALRDRGIDARVVVEAVDRDEIETGVRGPVEGHRIVGVESAITVLTERVAELERDNRRLRGTASFESQRVDRLQRGKSQEQEGENGGNEGNGNGDNERNENEGNGGNRNGGNGENRNRGMNYGCFMPMARECTF